MASQKQILFYVKDLSYSLDYYMINLECVIIRKNQTKCYMFSKKENAYVTLEEKDSIEQDLRHENCERCLDILPFYKLKYDDPYTQELVCKNCAGFRNCEICNKKRNIDSLVLNDDNYLVCKKCYQFDRHQCKRCCRIYYIYDLNYQANNEYSCDHCFEKENKEEIEEYDDEYY